jgi:cyanophycin synthetase
VIADYGHNPDAACIGGRQNAMPAQRRSVVSGGRPARDSDITDQTVILGAASDDVILYQTPPSAAGLTAR